MIEELPIIDKFRGDYFFLSNFYPFSIIYEGILYRTSEHAYQAAKTTDKELRQGIADLTTAGKAKRAGQKIELRPDWNDIRLLEMEKILIAKFATSKLRKSLIDTHPAYLIEGNDWGDTFWGTVNGKGENHLGNLLMKIRLGLLIEESIKANKANESST